MVDGLAEFQRRWGAIPDRVRTAAQEALEEVAADIVAQMKSVAPRRTGTLAGSIGWTWGDAPSGSMVIGTVGSADYGTMRITIYAAGGDAFYGKFQEFGTVKMPAHPFFFPVWRARRRGAKTKITRAINKAIKA